MESQITIPYLNHPLNAQVEIPGSKSITNRALLVAALAGGQSTLENALFSDDTHWCSTCLQQLGLPVATEPDAARFKVTGMKGQIPARQADLFVGNSGTTARFVTALAALGSGSYRFDGVLRMRERPMSEQLNLLQANGAEIEFEGQPGCMPYTLHSQGFKGGMLRLKANQTSQQLSALLMIAPYAQQDVLIEVMDELVSGAYIDITLQVMADFGVEVDRRSPVSFFIKAGQRYQPRQYPVEPDASNASYFFAAAALTGGRVRVNHLSRHSCQGDVRFVEVLAQMGCHVEATNNYIQVQGPAQLSGIDLDMNDMSDMVQTLAAIAPFAASPVTIRNIELIRWKETDRLKAVAAELLRLGARVEETNDGLKIYPGPLSPAAIETYDDHRMAMAFAVIGLKTSGLIIKNPSCTSKTFPDFFHRFFQVIAEQP
jgi:3-phosphoshikimate 1-carboxyvinyltransferase